ncbi:MAG: cytochrome b [Magnetococcales bacterium]|nr:cytochrome b [Magnetococcales bacterium]
MWRNSEDRYGTLARLWHWVMFALLVGMIVLGLWMTGLTYGDPWYHRAPALHEGLGIMTFVAFALRLSWRFFDPPPPLSCGIPRWQRLLAHGTHWVLYALMGVIPVSGYLITTARGEGVAVFGWFSIPALFPSRPGMEDLAGSVHLVLALALAGLALMHATAAVKHHVIDRDDTLVRMVPFLEFPEKHRPTSKEERS